MTLGDLFKSGKTVKVGDLVTFQDGTRILIGDATVYHAPTKRDAEIGWDWISPLCKKKIKSIQGAL